MAGESKRKRAGGDDSAPSVKPAKTAKKAAKQSELKFKNPAEFFRDNKNIAGFDNPGKSLFTSLREFIENSLDAAESINVLPDVEIIVEEITKAEFNSMVGVSNKGRIDESLYADFHEAANKKKGKKSKAAPTEENQGGEGGDDAPKAARNSEGIYQITVKDNGCGVKHDDIPNSFGRVLAGTKYGVKQTRGKFGLGSKMALIWAQMSTTIPIRIRSSTSKAKPISEFKLKINFEENRPIIEGGSGTYKPNEEGWRGTEIRVVIKGNWTTYKGKILHYLRQLAIITPYAEMDFNYRPAASASSGALRVKFARRSDQMPPHAKDVKYHPRSVNAVLLQELIGNTKFKTLDKFLEKEFSNVKKDMAARLIDELGDQFYPEMSIDELETRHINAIIQLFHAAKFDNPKGDHLSPAGEYNLRLGIMKELNPDLVATYAEPCNDFEGHGFIVEAGVCLGGKIGKAGINVFRFANRIPLLFEAGNDVVRQTATKRIPWNTYKINKNTDKIGVFVSIVSTKIPFKGTGKEYIGDDVEEYKRAVRTAIMGCCTQLKKKLAHKLLVQAQKDHIKKLQLYVNDVARAIFKTAEAIQSRKDDNEQGISDKGKEVCEMVQKRELSEPILKGKLNQHVEQIDVAQALEYEMAKGLQAGVKQKMWIAPISDDGIFLRDPIHTETVSMRLLQ